MAWPTPQDYSEAIQCPAHCFQDAELRSGTVETDRLGLPRPMSGQFAVVYRIRSAAKSYAVRCFQSDVKDLHERYHCIGTALGSASLPYFVAFQFLEKGIRVQGRWYPVLKMEWTEGEPLIDYVRRSLKSPDKLQGLADDWQAMCSALAQLRIAHGDLQHGNVLISGGRILLLDYDGMFVPSLQGKRANEVGHPNYQHPRRSGQHFDSWLDGFSAASIMASLLALSIDSQLWDQTKAGDESLLFRKTDYENPAASPVFRMLKNHPDQRLQRLAREMEGLLDKPIDQIGLPSAERLGLTLVKSLPGDGSWLSPIVRLQPPQPPQEVATLPRPSPPIPPPLPDWLETQTPPAESLHSFGGRHGGEKVILVTFWLASTAPAFLDGAAGLVTSVVLFPCAYIVWRHWIFSRFNKHPLLIERSMIEVRMAQKQAEGVEILARWNALKSDIENQRLSLENLPATLDSKRRDLENSQVTEIAAARERFRLARVQGEKRDEELVRNESAEVDRAKRSFDGRIRQLNRDLSALTGKRQAERHALWSTVNALKTQLKQLSGKFSTRRAVQVAALDREEGDLNSQLSVLAASRQSELDNALVTMQQQHLSAYLSRKRFIDASIDGIGPVLQARLADHGVRTAAEITPWNIRSIPGIGPQKQAAIDRWRKRFEGEAKRGMPASLPAQTELAIRQKYSFREAELNRLLSVCRSRRERMISDLASEEQREKDTLHAALEIEEDRARRDEQAIEMKYTDEKRRLNGEIQSVQRQLNQAVEVVKRGIQQQRESLVASRGASEQRLNADVAAITRRYSSEHERLRAESRAEEGRIQANITATTRKLDEISEEVRRVQAQAVAEERELRRFVRITYENYLSEALSF